MRRYGHLDTGDQCNDDQQNLQKYSMYISSPYWEYNKTYYQRINKFIRIIFFLSVIIDESLESVPTSPLDPNWGKGLPAPTPVVAAPLTPCGGLGRRRMLLTTCLQECRKGRGEAQPRKPAADNGFFSGRRKGTDTASNRSCGQLRLSQ